MTDNKIGAAFPGTGQFNKAHLPEIQPTFECSEHYPDRRVSFAGKGNGPDPMTIDREGCTIHSMGSGGVFRSITEISVHHRPCYDCVRNGGSSLESNFSVNRILFVQMGRNHSYASEGLENVWKSCPIILEMQ
jgi:hypothetical protein